MTHAGCEPGFLAIASALTSGATRPNRSADYKSN